MVTQIVLIANVLFSADGGLLANQSDCDAPLALELGKRANGKVEEAKVSKDLPVLMCLAGLPFALIITEYWVESVYYIALDRFQSVVMANPNPKLG